MKREEKLRYLLRLELARELLKDKEKFYRLEEKLSKARKNDIINIGIKKQIIDWSDLYE